jgi:hypothetical protein
MSNDLYRINGKHFVAGLEVNENGIVVNCAPILRRWCNKQHIQRVKKICEKRNLEIKLIKSEKDTKSLFFIDD